MSFQFRAPVDAFLEKCDEHPFGPTVRMAETIDEIIGLLSVGISFLEGFAEVHLPNALHRHGFIVQDNKEMTLLDN